jgi:uncharacterized radical SAM protein YgiQ
MAEASVIELAHCLKTNQSPLEIRGLCYLSKKPVAAYEILPSFEEVCSDFDAYIRMYHGFYHNTDPVTARGLAQQKGDRRLILNPPSKNLTSSQLDDIYSLEYEREQHPYYEKNGPVKALETIRFSIPTHRGCYGECNFCAIAVHEGRTVVSRSEDSILAEARRMTQHKKFKGIIHDLGGPTANMYAVECKKKLESGACVEKRCLFRKYVLFYLSTNPTS